MTRTRWYAEGARFPRALTALVAIMCLGAPAAATETRFTIVDSSSSSWIAHGYHDYTVSPANGWTFYAFRDPGDGVLVFDVMSAPSPGTVVTEWHMMFAAPYQATIVPGMYSNFQQYNTATSSFPGLEFTSTGRGVNMASGFFRVYEATYSPSGAVLSFSADFTHYGENYPSDYAIVELRYNATIPAPGVAVFAAAIPVFALRRRRIALSRLRVGSRGE